MPRTDNIAEVEIDAAGEWMGERVSFVHAYGEVQRATSKGITATSNRASATSSSQTSLAMPQVGATKSAQQAFLRCPHSYAPGYGPRNSGAIVNTNKTGPCTTIATQIPVIHLLCGRHPESNIQTYRPPNPPVLAPLLLPPPISPKVHNDPQTIMPTTHQVHHQPRNQQPPSHVIPNPTSKSRSKNLDLIHPC